MTHEELQDLLPRYATGALRMDEAAPVQAHLATGCSSCLAQVLGRPLGGPRVSPPEVAPAHRTSGAAIPAFDAETAADVDVVAEADAAVEGDVPAAPGDLVADGATHATPVGSPVPPGPSLTAMLLAPAPPLAPPAASTTTGAVGADAQAVPAPDGGWTAGTGAPRGALLLLGGSAAIFLTLMYGAGVRPGTLLLLALGAGAGVGVWVRGARTREAARTTELARHGALLLLALVGGAGLGVWVRDARTREAARTTELARTAERLTAAEQQRAQLENKLSVTARELAATRAAFEKRVASPPPVAVPPRPAVEETSVPEPEPEVPGVRYADDRLSVHVTAMPLDALILEIGRQAGAVVRGRTPDRKVSAQFDDVPLPEALERLIGAPNFSLVYDEQRRLRILDLLGPSVTPAPVVEAAAAPPPPPQDPVRSAEAALPLIDKHPPIALAGPLARWFKTETLSLRELIQTGLTHEDAAVRREALRTSINALENDPALAALLDNLARIDEATLESLARRLAGDHAEEVVRQVRMQVRRGDLRSKASSVLERFRTDAADAQG